MKTLFVSIVFFLFADNDLTTTNKSFSNNDEDMVSMKELMDFRNKEALEIERLLKPRSWEDGTYEHKNKGERSWVLTSPKALLYYYRIDKNDQAFEAPYLNLTIYSEDLYDELAEEAEYVEHELIACSDQKHGRGAGIDTEYHFYNKEYDILFSQSYLGNSKRYTIRVAGRKKK